MSAKTTINIKIIIASLAFFVITECKNDTGVVPKPYGYFRISMPENTYKKFDADKKPYTFEYSKIAEIEEHSDKPEQNWINIVYPKHNATIYITYLNIKNNLDTILNDSHNFTYRHTIKADAIEEITYFFPERNVFALYAEIEGDAASPIQFLMTDSTRNFVRGSLYFNAAPNSDSIAPVVDFIRKDIIHLLETLEWKK
ncbi:MAG: gliding motility lipoprotein GldD [Prevotellaceae bacterium]|jgi:gliding motility-associated lipoprotein GldD|nr:gliding motility lipoprotein GldD [Prevotellaceae bacterium]